MKPSTVAAAALALFSMTAWAGPGTARYAQDADGVFWFMHISDLHVGAPWFQNGHPVEHLTTALTEGVQVIKPIFLAATGDLVDGSNNEIPTSGQDQKEWDSYRSIYQAAKMTPTFYYDIIGNHDQYGNVGLSYYLANSLQGTNTGMGHMAWTHTTPLGKYYFYGLNTAGDKVAAFSLGNGTLLDGEYDSLKLALAANTDAQLTFVLAHHRPYQPVNSQRLVDLLGQQEAFYLHGHIHEYDEYVSGNGKTVVNEVNSLGLADIENLAVGVVDHNAFVYRATSIKDPWPFVIITAPVSRQLRNASDNPWAYTVCRDRADNPVRALVFSKIAPTSVEARIGGLPSVQMKPVAGTPSLYSVQIDTRGLVNTGAQAVTVTAISGGVSRQHAISVNFVNCGGATDGGVPADMAAPRPDLGVKPDLFAADLAAARPDLLRIDAGAVDAARPADLRETETEDLTEAEPDDLAQRRDFARPSADASVAPPEEGCSCQVGQRGRAPSLSLVPLALLLAAALRRRRRDR